MQGDRVARAAAFGLGGADDDLADLGHRPRQVPDFLDIQREGRTRRDESGEVDIRVAASNDVRNDPAKGASIQTAAINSSAHVRQ